MRTLLILPPLYYPFGPYSSTSVLAGFLKSRGEEVFQLDASIELILRLYSKTGLERIRDEIVARSAEKVIGDPIVQKFLENFRGYHSSIEPAIHYLQGRDVSLAVRFASGRFFPETLTSGAWAKANYLAQGIIRQSMGENAFRKMSCEGDSTQLAMNVLFGRWGIEDKARFFATLFLQDISLIIRTAIEPDFHLDRNTGYGDLSGFDDFDLDSLLTKLQGEETLVRRMLREIISEHVDKVKPDVVGVSVPFVGMVRGAFEIVREVKKANAKVQTILGGGFVNTEWRKNPDIRIFDDFDFLTLDDGELPLLGILKYLKGERKDPKNLYKTFINNSGIVIFASNSGQQPLAYKDAGIPTYGELISSHYLSVSDVFSNVKRPAGWWNEMILTRGCYWAKCAFCDTGLDYIGKYDPVHVDLILQRMKSLIAETKSSAFFFPDEAASPALLKQLSQRILQNNMTLSWYTLVRFEKAFTPELASLMAKAGCINVSGGIEVASDEILKIMRKGVTVSQVARVTHAFSSVGISVRAFLMYGFPNQTLQEVVNGLELVRQLFRLGCIQLGSWSRFVVTAPSPVGQNPEKYGIRLTESPNHKIGAYKSRHTDPTIDHDLTSVGSALRLATMSFNYGAGLDRDITSWFKEVGLKVSPPNVSRHEIEKILEASPT